MEVGWRQLKMWVLSCVVVATMAAACTTEAATTTLSPADVSQSQPTAAAAITELWVDALHGSDDHSGASAEDALATISAAWAQIPADVALSDHGYRIQLLPGDYAEGVFPVYWEARKGTAAAPIEMIATAGPGTAHLHGFLNFFDVDYMTLTNLDLKNEGDVFHCEKCSHFTLQGLRIDGGTRQAHEVVKINQSQYITITGNEIFGAYENLIDFVAVQYGTISDNRLHDADDWCMYLKGGSAYFRIERNLIYNCGTGGFTAGQGTGFEFMTAPWLQYEAYDIKFVNNIIHDSDGAGMGVNGGYDILLAYNTLYRVGARSHIIEVVFGGRECDGDSDACSQQLAQGGWGSLTQDEEAIPNRNVYIYNNLIYNPPGYQSQWQQFAIYGPRATGESSNIPSPALTDENLQIGGNWIWNGPQDHPLGVGDEEGCAPSNPTCNQQQLLADNSINQSEPVLVDGATGDFHLAAASNSPSTLNIPDFDDWSGPAPVGALDNEVRYDYAKQPRASGGIPGAYAAGGEAPATTVLLFLPGLLNASPSRSR